MGSGLAFEGSGAAAWAGLALLALLAWISAAAWRRSGGGWRVARMEAFRLLLALLAWIGLWGPEWRWESAAQVRDTVAVLADRSASMEIADLETAQGLQTRAASIAPLLDREAWEAPGMEVALESFSSEEGIGGTDIHRALVQALESHPGLRGVVLLSDGDWNEGLPPARAAVRLRSREVPVFAVAAGSEVPLPDLALEEFGAPSFCVAGKPVRIPYALGSALGQDQDAVLHFAVDGEVRRTLEVRVPAMGRWRSALAWEPQEPGDHVLSLELAPVPADRNSANNRREAPVSVRLEALRALVIDSLPRWEYRYLRNALERDPGVDVRCLLFHPRLPVVGDGPGYLDRFPSPEDLAGYDVAFLGDAGLAPGQLTEEQALQLRLWVGSQAAGLVFLPGRQGWQETLRGSPLDDLLPVETDPGSPLGQGSERPGRLVLTGAGRSSLLVQLAGDPEASAGVWRRLPGFHWHAPAIRARLGSEVLAVHEWREGPSGRLPLIATRTHGAGKTLFMGTDGAWRWREGVEDLHHYRFWGQVVRWMAYQRQKARGESMRLFCSPEIPRIRTRVALQANVLDAVGGLLEQGEVQVRIAAPSGRIRTVNLEPGRGDERGLFSGSFEPDEPGVHRLEARCPQAGARADLELAVQGFDRERQGGPARHDVLREIASLTGGSVVSPAEASSLPARIRALPDPRPETRRLRLWAHPLWWGSLTLLLGLFWFLRRRTGTI